jgi:hypothetical protein
MKKNLVIFPQRKILLRFTGKLQIKPHRGGAAENHSAKLGAFGVNR